MIELTNTVTQTVQPGATATFDTTVFCCGHDVCHRCGSGLVQLEGHGHPCNPAKYHVSISGNISAPAVGIASVAVAVNGETLFETQRNATIAAANASVPFAAQTNVKECGSCCDTVSIKNVGTEAITLSNMAFAVRRIS